MLLFVFFVSRPSTFPLLFVLHKRIMRGDGGCVVSVLGSHSQRCP